MSSLQFAEKQLFEKIFEMADGSLLDFSHSTLLSFFNDFEIDLGNEKYDKYGTSKAKRFRAFWELENVIMTPHHSGATIGTLDRRAATVAANIDRLAKGQPLMNVISGFGAK